MVTTISGSRRTGSRASTLRDDCANNGIVTAVEAIYAAALDPLRWPTALAATAACMGDVGAVLLWLYDDGSFGSIVSQSLLGVQRDWKQEKWHLKESCQLSAVPRGYFYSGVPFTERHLSSNEEDRAISSYTQFLVRHGLGSFGAVGVSPDPHVGVIFSVLRKARRRAAYSADELSTIARLGCHVQKSLRLSARLLNSELQKVCLGDALSRVGIGVFILDSSGHVLFVNQTGQDLLGEALTLGHDGLLIGGGTARSALELAIKQVIRPFSEIVVHEPKPVLARCPKTDRPLAIYALPLAPSTHPAAQFGPHARAVVVAIGLKVGDAPDPELVRDVLGLTLGEARLAAHVGSGVTLREAAEKLGITEETARTVLKHVFSKAGVSRQSELVSLMSRMVLR